LLVAKGYYEQALNIDLSVRTATDLASDYGNIANALDGLGDLDGARKMEEQALASFEKAGERRGAAATLNNLGNLMVEIGDPENARKDYERALSVMLEISYGTGVPYPTAGLGDALLMEGDIAGARKRYEEALKLSQETHQDDYSAQIQTSLAVVALEEKRFTDCDTLARGSMAIFDKDNAPDNGAWARAVLARSLLAEGKVAEAEDAAVQAGALSQRTPSQPQRFEATLADARAKAKAGKVFEANKELEVMLSSTHKSGYRSFEYQARLAMAEIELQSHSALARSHLVALEEDARTHGLLRVANHAQALSQSK